MEDAVLLDTTIAVYALGGDDFTRARCRALLDRAASGEFRPYASVEMIQEFVHHRLRRTGNRADSTADGRDVAASCTVINFDREILELSLDLIERHPSVRGRDAVHAATALAYGITRIASTDRAFDAIPGITRIDPLEL
jgi:predicted nucleic acid-binding protein